MVTDLQEQNKIVPSSKLMGMQVIYFEFNCTLIGGNIGTWLFGIKDTAPIWFAMLGLALYPAPYLVYDKYSYPFQIIIKNKLM